MNKLHTLNVYEIWTDGKTYNVYDPLALAGKFDSEIKALEWVSKLPDPKKGDDRGPIRHARHTAKCLLQIRLDEAKAMINAIEGALAQ